MPNAARLGACVGIGVLLMNLASCASTSTIRGQIDIVESFVEEPPDTSYLFGGAEDATDTLCHRLNCSQAVRFDNFVLLKFSKDSDATLFASDIRDNGVQIEPLVLDFRGSELSETSKEVVVDAISELQVDIPD